MKQNSNESICNKQILNNRHYININWTFSVRHYVDPLAHLGLWNVVLKMSIYSKLKKQTVVYLYSRTLLDNGSKQITLQATHLNIGTYCWVERPRKNSVCCCCSVAQLCLTLCDPMDCSAPCFPVLHHLPEFAQIHDHWVIPFFSYLQSFPASESFPASGSFPMS